MQNGENFMWIAQSVISDISAGRPKMRILRKTSCYIGFRKKYHF